MAVTETVVTQTTPRARDEVRQRRNIELKTMFDEATVDVENANAAGNSRRAQRAESRRQAVFAEFYNENSGLIGEIVRKFGQTRRDLDDLRAAGAVAFWEAFCSWDHQRAPFANHAWRRIERAVKGSVRNDEFSSMTYSTWTQRPAVLKAARTLGPNASHTEIAAASGVSVATVRTVMLAEQRTVSLDAPLYDDVTVGDTIAAETDATVDGPENGIIAGWLAELTPRAAWILVRRYGFDGAPAFDRDQIAVMLGCSRETVRAAENSALEQLRSLVDGVDVTGLLIAA